MKARVTYLERLRCEPVVFAIDVKIVFRHGCFWGGGTQHRRIELESKCVFVHWKYDRMFYDGSIDGQRGVVQQQRKVRKRL